MLENLQVELMVFIQEERALHQDMPFLNEHENGEREGVNKTLDGLEKILSKYFTLPKQDLEELSQEPKSI